MCHRAWPTGLGGCDYLQHAEIGRSSWLIGVSPYHQGLLIRGRQEHQKGQALKAEIRRPSQWLWVVSELPR